LLRDSSSFIFLHISLPDLVKQLGLSSIDVSQNTANGRAEVVFVPLGKSFLVTLLRKKKKKNVSERNQGKMSTFSHLFSSALTILLSRACSFLSSSVAFFLSSSSSLSLSSSSLSSSESSESSDSSSSSSFFEGADFFAA